MQQNNAKHSTEDSFHSACDSTFVDIGTTHTASIHMWYQILYSETVERTRVTPPLRVKYKWQTMPGGVTYS